MEILERKRENERVFRLSKGGKESPSRRELIEGRSGRVSSSGDHCTCVHGVHGEIGDLQEER